MLAQVPAFVNFFAVGICVKISFAADPFPETKVIRQQMGLI